VARNLNVDDFVKLAAAQEIHTTAVGHAAVEQRR
jgi:hypothetical protein